VIVENDLYRRAAADVVDAALAAAKTVVLLDHQITATSAKAGLLLAGASFAETEGTLINNEGRAQRFFQVYDPAFYDNTVQVRDNWRWLHAIHTGIDGKEFAWKQLDDVIEACIACEPELAAIRAAAPRASFRIKGLKLAREPRRYSGRTSMRANISVHEPRASQDPDSPLAHSMEGYVGKENPASLMSFAWSPGWNSPQAWNKFQDEVGGQSLKGDAGERLIEVNAQATLHYFTEIPAAFVASATKLRLVPLYHLFGSEELSSRASVVQERIPTAYVAISAADAAQLGTKASSTVIVRALNKNLRLPVKVSAALAQGCVGLPVGLEGIPAFAGENWAQIMQEAV
jgi:NADH-quinone oxidoreductase subunit G